jgi:hypothetical protein
VTDTRTTNPVKPTLIRLKRWLGKERARVIDCNIIFALTLISILLFTTSVTTSVTTIGALLSSGTTPKYCPNECRKRVHYERARQDPAKRAAAVARAKAWCEANRERSREIRREYARRQREKAKVAR